MGDDLPKLGATDRVLSCMTVLDWPVNADEELAETIVNLTTLELANDAPAVIEGDGARHLVWRGYLTGGLLTLYEGLVAGDAPARVEHLLRRCAPGGLPARTHSTSSKVGASANSWLRRGA